MHGRSRPAWAMLFALPTLLFLASCRPADLPSVSLENIDRVVFESAQSRQASADEVRRLVEGYNSAEGYDQDVGTTAPVRAEIVLMSGESILLFGGGQTFQTVVKGDRQWNIHSEALHDLLREVDAGAEGCLLPRWLAVPTHAELDGAPPSTL